MVYITNGYNLGVSKIIGDAFREESLARRTSNDVSPNCANYGNQLPDELDKVILIGILSTSDLKNAELLNGSQENVTYKIDEQDASSHSLNPDHTHFVLVDDDNVHIKLLKFRVALEKRLQRPILNRKAKKSNPNFDNMTTEIVNDESKNSIETSHEKIPIVSLLIGGGIGSISLVLTKIYQGIPILVFKGTGHAPDLISGG